MANWYYVKGGRQSDAMSEDALRRLVASGEVGADDLIWCDGMANWLPVRAVPEFGGRPPPVYVDPPANMQPAQAAAPMERGAPAGRPGKPKRGKQTLAYQTPAPQYGGGGGGDEGLSGLDWVLIVLCPGIAFILGIIRLCTGKRSGLTLIIAAVVSNVIWVGIRLAINSAHG